MCNKIHSWDYICTINIIITINNMYIIIKNQVNQMGLLY